MSKVVGVSALGAWQRDNCANPDEFCGICSARVALDSRKRGEVLALRDAADAIDQQLADAPNPSPDMRLWHSIFADFFRSRAAQIWNTMLEEESCGMSDSRASIECTAATDANSEWLHAATVKRFIADLPDGAVISQVVRDFGNQRDPEVRLVGLRASWSEQR